MNETVTAQNPHSIREMFGVISGKYDLANTILSFGIHHQWKKALIRQSGLKSGDRVLDCATGTGDLAFQFASTNKDAQVVGTDFCEPMLDVARKKATERRSNIQFETADVTQLQFNDREFNIASISFGIRNVRDTKQALSELGRVVQSGGKVLVLEFGQPRSRVMGFLFNFYSRYVLPRVGGWISGQKQAYQYLQTSSATYPCGADFLAIAQSTGRYQTMRCVPFQTGIAYLYILDVK